MMDESVHVSVRKIENGFVISKSWHDKKGGYQNQEVYSETPPDLTKSVFEPKKMTREEKAANWVTKHSKAKDAK